MDLLSPLTFRNGVVSKNRVLLAAMTNQQSHDDGTLSDEELHWLTVRAKGGFGVITTCASHVAKDGQGWPGELGIFDDKQIPGHAKIAKNSHDHGALAFVQIFHGGLRADEKVSGSRPWSANEVEGGPRAGTEEDIVRVIEQFSDAADRALRAGMDGVEIHGAHGYLLGQFLSSVENTRTDGWGGTFAKRARLMREVTRAVRARVPHSFVVGVRISPEDFGQAKGLDVDDNVTLAKWLVEEGADFIHLSLWRSERNTTKHPDRHPVTLFRDALPKDVPLLAAGNIWTRAEANFVLEKGADGVALARPAIVNPDWPKRVADENWEPKRPPLTVAELVDRGLSPKFAGYLRQFKTIVAD